MFGSEFARVDSGMRSELHVRVTVRESADIERGGGESKNCERYIGGKVAIYMLIRLFDVTNLFVSMQVCSLTRI